MSENKKTEQNSEKPMLGPGERLQAARISVGMTLEDVANKMHLSSEILNSLEENDFDDITAPIFVKGYLRAYARLVNVDENEIIDQYSNFYTDGDPPISTIRNTMPEINADDARVKWTTYLVIFVLITLLFMWWWNRYQQPSETVSLESELSNSSGSLKLPEENIVINPVEAGISAISLPVESNTDGDSNQPSDEAPVETNVVVVETPEESQTSDMDNASSLPNELAVTEENTVTEAVAATEIKTENTVATPQNIDKDLTIIINADTWADVRDATGEKLIYDLLKAGEVINVEGKKPYNAFFGNGYGVSIKFQGGEVDLTNSIQSNNTARIKIGN